MELGQIDIHFEVSRMSSYMASPRIGHFEQVLHIFGYLQNVPKFTLVMDPLMPNVSEDRFIEADWHDFYRDAKEEIPTNLPVPKVNLYPFHVLLMPQMFVMYLLVVHKQV